jgi:tetratricopeptide (TPR) repeat protein
LESTAGGCIAQVLARSTESSARPAVCRPAHAGRPKLAGEKAARHHHAAGVAPERGEHQSLVRGEGQRAAIRRRHRRQGSDPEHRHWRARLYALGLLAVPLGEPEAAARAAAQLEALTGSDEITGPARSLAAAVRADLALASRRPADALTALADVRGAVPLSLSDVSPFSEDYARYLRAEALLALGKDAEARRWLENGFGNTPDAMTFRVPVLLRLGDLYERAGERQKAIDAYARVVRLWSACEPPLRPVVEDARARLGRLTAEPRS